MSQFCISCGVENEPQASFCRNCGEKLDKGKYQDFDKDNSNKNIKKETPKESNKDLSLWYLLIPFLISCFSHIQKWKVQYDKEDVGTLDYALHMIGSGIPEVYGELFGAGIAPILFATIIVGIVWLVKGAQSKIYLNAKLSLFIWSLLFAILAFFGSL